MSSSEPIQHSILKSPRFEVNATSSNDNAADLDDFMVDDDQLQQDEEDIEELEAYGIYIIFNKLKMELEQVFRSLEK